MLIKMYRGVLRKLCNKSMVCYLCGIVCLLSIVLLAVPEYNQTTVVAYEKLKQDQNKL